MARIALVLLLTAATHAQEEVKAPARSQSSIVIEQSVIYIKDAKGKDKLFEIGQLSDQLNDFSNKRDIPDEPSRRLLTAAIAPYVLSLDKRDPLYDLFIAKGAEILGPFGEGPQTKEIVFLAAEHPSERIRDHSFWALVSRTSSIPKEERWNYLMSLQDKKLHKLEWHLHAIQKLDGERALPILQDIVKNSTDKGNFQAASKILQYYQRPEYLDDMLARLKEMGFGSGEYWLDHRLIAQRMLGANKSELKKLLNLFENQLLDCKTVISMVEKNKMLDNADPEIRLLALEFLRIAFQRDQSLAKDVKPILLSQGKKEVHAQVAKKVREVLKAWEDAKQGTIHYALGQPTEESRNSVLQGCEQWYGESCK